MRQSLAPGVRSIVLDCEAQAWDSERKVFLPFQVLTTRKRKDVKEEDVKVQVFVSAAFPLPHSHGYALSGTTRCLCLVLYLLVQTADGIVMSMQVVLYCFDCLYLDGDVLLRKPLRVRREAMYRSIVPHEGQVQFATAKTSRDIDELQACSYLTITPCKRVLQHFVDS